MEPKKQRLPNKIIPEQKSLVIIDYVYEILHNILGGKEYEVF